MIRFLDEILATGKGERLGASALQLRTQDRVLITKDSDTPPESHMAVGQSLQLSCSLMSVQNTAFHEAGHYVASFLLFPSRIRGFVSILKKGSTVGRTAEEELDRSNRDEVEKEIVILFSGFAAETRFRPNERGLAKLGAADDDEQALDLLDSIGVSTKARSGLRKKLRARSRALIEKHWKLIRSLAKELLVRPEIDAEEADLILLAASGDQDASNALVQLRSIRVSVGK